MLAKVANVDQARSWDGGDGDHWTEHVEIYDGAVEPHYRRMREVMAVAPGERVLDIGCGTGETTIDAARDAGHGSANGVDLSSRMLDFARRRANEAGVTNATFEQADAQVHEFDRGAYDLAISRTGCMFFDDPVAAFTNIGHALRPGGRLVLMTWQGIDRNEWLREIQTALVAGRPMPPPPADAPGPLSLSEPAAVRGIMDKAGFNAVELEAVNERFWLGRDAAAAFEFFRDSGIVHGMLDDTNADDETRTRAMGNLRATFASHDTGKGVFYQSGAWLITARKP